jgi:hypothetical protein
MSICLCEENLVLRNWKSAKALASDILWFLIFSLRAVSSCDQEGKPSEGIMRSGNVYLSTAVNIGFLIQFRIIINLPSG